MKKALFFDNPVSEAFEAGRFLPGYATIFSGSLTRRSFHYYDGRLSIRRGFMPEELRDLIQGNFPNKAIHVVETYRPGLSYYRNPKQ